MIIAFIGIGLMTGFLLSNNYIGRASADSSTSTNSGDDTVDRATLEQLYLGFFGRTPDQTGLTFHVGRKLKDVLRDFNNSEEHRYYAALFKSVKAYEEAVRAPGDLSADDQHKYLDAIDSYLATLLASVATLPEQPICHGTTGIIEARQAIQDAYDNMSPTAKVAARKGMFKALNKLPKDLSLPIKRCFPTVTPNHVLSITPSSTPASTEVPDSGSTSY